MVRASRARCTCLKASTLIPQPGSLFFTHLPFSHIYPTTASPRGGGQAFKLPDLSRPLPLIPANTPAPTNACCWLSFRVPATAGGEQAPPGFVHALAPGQGRTGPGGAAVQVGGWVGERATRSEGGGAALRAVPPRRSPIAPGLTRNGEVGGQSSRQGGSGWVVGGEGACQRSPQRPSLP